MWEFCPDIIFEMWECEQITGIHETQFIYEVNS